MRNWFVFLRRLRALHRLSREDRGQELDRVLKAMEEGATFTGAKGHMLLYLAKDRRWVEMNMRMNAHCHLPEQQLGEAWARRLNRHIKATRTEGLAEGERQPIPQPPLEAVRDLAQAAQLLLKHGMALTEPHRQALSSQPSRPRLQSEDPLHPCSSPSRGSNDASG